MPNLVCSLWFVVCRNRKKTISHLPPPTTYQSGFTLIELLVVILIIAVLVGVGAFTYSSAQLRGRDTTRKQDLEAIKAALELARQDQSGFYPNDLSSLTPTYIKVLPLDPKSGASYAYTPQPEDCTTDCTGYFLQTTLENSNDPDREPSWENCPGAPGGPDYVVCPSK